MPTYSYSTNQTASWDEANKCLYCKQAMVEVAKLTPPRNVTSRIHVLDCMNDDCPYYRQTKAAAIKRFGHEINGTPTDGDRWRKQVTTLADGTVPILPTGRAAKQWQPLPKLSDEARQRMEDSLRTDDELMQRLAKEGGARLDPQTGRVHEPPPE